VCMCFFHAARAARPDARRAGAAGSAHAISCTSS